MAEWLGSALQKLLQRFKSASDLQNKIPVTLSVTGILVFPLIDSPEGEIFLKNKHGYI